MSAGLYSRDVVAKWMGKRVTELERMIREDGLPSVRLPARQKVRHKFSASQLVRWLNQRSNMAWTVELLREELDAINDQQEEEVVA